MGDILQTAKLIARTHAAQYVKKQTGAHSISYPFDMSKFSSAQLIPLGIDPEFAEDVEIDITFNLSPFVAATMYDRNGDPGSPAEGGELETISAEVSGIDVSHLVADDLDGDDDFITACIESVADEYDDSRYEPEFD